MFGKLERHFQRARHSVWLFYLLSAVIAYYQMYDLHVRAITAAELDFAWPVMWLGGRDLVRWVDVLSFGALATSLLACWKPNLLSARLGFALFTLGCGGFYVSFGGVNHLYHMWFWVALVLVFLPNAAERGKRLSYCVTFAMAQGLILAFYTMAGLWKLLYGLNSLWHGVEGNLSPRGLSLTLADRIVQTGTEPLIGRFVAENYWLSWPMFLAMIYIQAVALMVVFKPRLHVAWGLALVAFHIGTWLLMEIVFPLHFMILLVFLVLSPFRTDDWLKWETLRDLPIFGPLFRFKFKPDTTLAPAE